MTWLLTLFADLRRCIKELAERTKNEEDSDSKDKESSDGERIDAELKDSDDDVVYGEYRVIHLQTFLYGIFLEKYWKFREEEIFRRVQRLSRRKSNTLKSMEVRIAEMCVCAESPADEFGSVSDTDSEDRFRNHHFQVVFFSLFSFLLFLGKN